jgi:hypothetical protein
MQSQSSNGKTESFAGLLLAVSSIFGDAVSAKIDESQNCLCVDVAVQGAIKDKLYSLVGVGSLPNNTNMIEQR